jgi:hypothetical protein
VVLVWGGTTCSGPLQEEVVHPWPVWLHSLETVKKDSKCEYFPVSIFCVQPAFTQNLLNFQNQLHFTLFFSLVMACVLKIALNNPSGTELRINLEPFDGRSANSRPLCTHNNTTQENNVYTSINK